MHSYIEHHLKVSGLKKNIFNENAISAIYQGSAGILRHANFLSKGSLMACMIEKEDTVTEEHVRRASTEFI
jgi:general secretion pathway protein A